MISVTESPEDPRDVWVNITAPEDEEKEEELIELAGDKGTDILIDYGYHIFIMLRSSNSEMVRKFKSQGISKQLV